MKKVIIASLLFLGIVFTPVYASADIVALNQQEMRFHLIQLITQLIQVLQQQLNDLIAQQQKITQGTSVMPSPVETQPQSPVTSSGTQITNIVPKKMPTTIEIVSPIAGKGLGRKYIASSQINSESNYIEIGAIVRDGDGNPVKNMVVQVDATDTNQSKTLNGTGDVKTIYVDGAKQVVPYYHFHYEFKTSGKHTITFTADGVVQSVELSVE